MKKALLVYNPMSGNRFVMQNLDSIVDSFQQEDVYLELYRIAKEDVLIDYVKDTKVDLIVGAGGDGTISQVITSILHHGVQLPFMALGTGTSNNFTRNIEATKSITSENQAKKVIHDALKGNIQKLDVGQVNNKNIFLTSLAGGNFVETTYATDKNLKYMFGSLAYYIKPLSELTSLKSYNVRITVDGQHYNEKIAIFVMVNGAAVGNFDNFVTDASMSDGIMELVLIKESSAKDNLALFRSIVKGVDISQNKNVKILRGKSFYIECDEAMPITLDGEEGPALPLSVEVIHEAIAVYVPETGERGDMDGE